MRRLSSSLLFLALAFALNSCDAQKAVQTAKEGAENSTKNIKDCAQALSDGAATDAA
jgi:hypothetical protein